MQVGWDALPYHAEESAAVTECNFQLMKCATLSDLFLGQAVSFMFVYFLEVV